MKAIYPRSRPITMRLRLAMTLSALLMTVSQAGHADNGWLDRQEDKLKAIFLEGNTDLYLPFHTEHLRFAYDAEQVDRFQQSPPGIGIGQGRYRTDGSWDGVYAMGFQDSHYKPEWMLGYGRKYFWRPTDNMRLGAGYTAFLTARSDTLHYFPFPVVLPVISAGYKNAAV